VKVICGRPVPVVIIGLPFPFLIWQLVQQAILAESRPLGSVETDGSLRHVLQDLQFHIPPLAYVAPSFCLNRNPCFLHRYWLEFPFPSLLFNEQSGLQVDVDRDASASSDIIIKMGFQLCKI
jgi:hypothetical protein